MSTSKSQPIRAAEWNCFYFSLLFPPFHSLLFNDSVKFRWGQSIRQIPEIKNKMVRSETPQMRDRPLPHLAPKQPQNRRSWRPRSHPTHLPYPSHWCTRRTFLRGSAILLCNLRSYLPPGRPFKGDFCHWFWVSRVKDRRRRIGPSRDSVVWAPLSISLFLSLPRSASRSPSRAPARIHAEPITDVCVLAAAEGLLAPHTAV